MDVTQACDRSTTHELQSSSCEVISRGFSHLSTPSPRDRQPNRGTGNWYGYRSPSPPRPR